MSDNAPGWQPDPTGRFEHRYWDGSQWTDNVSDAGVASTDAYSPDAAADAGGAETPAAPEEPAEAGAPAGEAPGWDDPTVTQPAAPSDPTATWPATPPPPSFTPPVPADGGPAGAASSGSKKRLLIGGGILAAIAIAVIAFLALGKDDTSAVRAELASKIREQDGSISAKQAECVADLLVDEAGEDAFKDVNLDADEPSEDVLKAFVAVGPDRLVKECGIDASAFGGSSDTTDTTDGGGSIGSDADLPPDFEQQLADVYETSMGLPKEKAECLAGKIADAIESGDLSEEQAMSDIFGYLSDCDIDMSELSGN